MKKSLLLTSCALFACPGVAFAQSTGTVDFEKETIVVTGTRSRDVGGVQAPDAPKAKAVITQELIARSGPGQTVLDTINVVPGVSFQNNDAYGNSGGTLSIRGFDSTRVSYTLDGVQLNDSGNYNIYSNFSIDPELIEQVNVNLGSTDVDSPTASAVGGTINQRTRTPSKRAGGLVNISLGEYDYRRFFGMADLGEFTSFGTRAFIAASTSKYDNPFNNYGKLDRQQYNAKIWQPVGSNGDFISVAGRYNQDRNNFFGFLPLRLDADRVVGPNNSNRFPRNGDERFYDINYPCQLDKPQAGVVDTTAAPPPGQASCGTEFDRRYNPSNSANVRANSRFTIAEGLILTVDPSYQYTKANGGGTIIGREGVRTIGGVNYTGFIGGQYYFGRDLNGDGDIIDTCVPSTPGGSCSSTNFQGVTLLAPSQTITNRYGVIANLLWEVNESNSFRVSLTRDHARHRQTGEVGFLKMNGEPVDVFPVNDPIEDANGNDVQKRDRLSFAILNQVAGEYRGQFLEDRLTVNVGVRAPFFKRRLDNRCFTTSASGFVDCFNDPEAEAAYALANPYVVDPTTGKITGAAKPQKRTFKYNKLLPNIGAIYDFTPQISAFVSYAKNISVPSTDNLYNSFFFPEDADGANPKPEITNTFDGGLRYRSSRIQAQVAGWYTRFDDRTASAFDPELNASVFRNLGRVNKWGLDGSVAYEPIKALTLYAFGSWNKSKIKDAIQVGELPIVGGEQLTCADRDLLLPSQIARSCAFTSGNRESGAPKYTYGFSGVGRLGLVELGLTAKKTGSRFVFDNGAAVFNGTLANLDDTNPANDPVQVYGNKVPAYWLVNLDARFNLKMLRGLENSYFQLNVYNLFDKFYVGGFGGGLAQSLNTSGSAFGNPPNVAIGAPRTISGTLSLSF